MKGIYFKVKILKLIILKNKMEDLDFDPNTSLRSSRKRKKFVVANPDVKPEDIETMRDILSVQGDIKSMDIENDVKDGSNKRPSVLDTNAERE